MTEIDVEIIERLPEPEEGHVYIIEKVEPIKTAVRGLEGWRVTLRDVETGALHATMLWKRERVGPSSKLGTFLKALGKNAEVWIGKKVRLVSWKPRDRRIEATVGEATGEGADLAYACKEHMVKVLEPGKAYTISDAKACGLNYPEDVISKAFEMLVSEGKAFRLPTKPAKWFLEG